MILIHWNFQPLVDSPFGLNVGLQLQKLFQQEQNHISFKKVKGDVFLILCSNSIFNINVDCLGGGNKNQNDLTCLLASLAWFSLKSTSTWTQTSLSLLGSQNLGYFRWLKGLFLVGIPSLGHLGNFIRCQRVHLHFQGFFSWFVITIAFVVSKSIKKVTSSLAELGSTLPLGILPMKSCPLWLIFTCYLVCNFSSHLVSNFFQYFIHKHILLCFKKCLTNIFFPLSDGKLGCVKRCCDLYYFQVPHITIDDNIFNFEFDENIIFSYELESHFCFVFISVQGYNLFHFPSIHTRSQDITSNTTYHIINNQHISLVLFIIKFLIYTKVFISI